MIDYAKSGKIDCIIVKDLSRFGRNYIEVGDYLEHIFPFLGIRIISINDRYDSNDYSGKTSGMDIAFRNLIYDYYSKDLSKKVKSAMSLKQRDAKFLNCIIYGYKASPEDKHQMIIDEEAATVVRRVFSEIIAGKSTSEVAKGLNKDGIPTPSIYKGVRNKNNTIPQWTHMRIHEMLKSIKYTGTMVNHTRESRFIRDKSQRKCPESEWIIRENAHEAIISKEDFEKANEMIRRRRMNEKKPDNSGDRVYVCGYCGRKLEKANGTVFACSSHRFHENSDCKVVRFRKEDMEQVLFDALKGQLSVITLKAKESTSKKGGEHKEIKRKLDELISELTRLNRLKLDLYEKYRSGDFSAGVYVEKKDSINTEIENLKFLIAEMEQRYKESLEKADAEKENLKRASKIQNTDDDFLFKNMYEAVEKVVVFAPNRIEIQWKFDDLFGALRT